MKKLLLIIMLSLVFLSCSKKDNSTTVGNMQDISNEIGFQAERERVPVVHEEPPVRIQEPEPEPEPEPQVVTPVVEAGNYTAQLISLRIEIRAVELYNRLRASGYDVELQEVVVNNYTMYRIRLAGSYSREFAENLAEKIQSEFREIEDFWIVRR